MKLDEAPVRANLLSDADRQLVDGVLAGQRRPLAKALPLIESPRAGRHERGQQGVATLVPQPWLWALPALHAMPLQLQWSGACLVVLMLGWPLAVPVMLGVGAITGLISPMDWQQSLHATVWQGLVPGTLALLMGALLRRLTGEQMFVYILGRAFLGTVLCVFTTAVLAQWIGSPLPGVDPQLSLVAHWLMAWGDAIVTGMLCAIFVAFRPQWLATWSDRLYLRP